MIHADRSELSVEALTMAPKVLSHNIGTRLNVWEISHPGLRQNDQLSSHAGALPASGRNMSESLQEVWAAVPDDLRYDSMLNVLAGLIDCSLD